MAAGVKKVGTTRKPDPVKDALAALYGTEQLTAQEGKRVGVAAAGIRRATPNVSPDEIRRRANNYTRLSWNRDHRTPSPMALASNWADCDMPGTAVPPVPRNRYVGDMSDAELEEAMRDVR